MSKPSPEIQSVSAEQGDVDQEQEEAERDHDQRDREDHQHRLQQRVDDAEDDRRDQERAPAVDPDAVEERVREPERGGVDEQRDDDAAGETVHAAIVPRRSALAHEHWHRAADRDVVRNPVAGRPVDPDGRGETAVLRKPKRAHLLPRPRPDRALEPDPSEPADEAGQLQLPAALHRRRERVEREHADVEERRADAEQVTSVLAGDAARTGGELHFERTGAAGRVPLDDDVAQARRVQPRRELGAREDERGPGVVLREVVVRIGDRDEIRARARLRPDVFDVGGPPAGGRVVVGGSDVSPPRDDLPGRLGDGAVRLGPLALDPVEDLVARVGVEVEALLGVEGRQRVRPGDDGLGLQGLQRPVVRHLARHDAAEVVVERQLVDRVKPAVLDVDGDSAAVRLPVDAERRRARLVEDGAAELADPRDRQAACAALERQRPPLREPAERLRGGDLDPVGDPRRRARGRSGSAASPASCRGRSARRSGRSASRAARSRRRRTGSCRRRDPSRDRRRRRSSPRVRTEPAQRATAAANVQSKRRIEAGG